MALQEQLLTDMKVAMKAHDSNRVATLRMMRAALQNAEIAHGGRLDDKQVLAVLDKEAKKRREAIAAYEQAGREDLVAQERAELEVLQAYLPQPLSEESLKELIAAAIAQVGATSRRDMGAVMKVVMPQVRGRADGKLVNQLVIRQLSN